MLSIDTIGIIFAFNSGTHGGQWRIAAGSKEDDCKSAENQWNYEGPDRRRMEIEIFKSDYCIKWKYNNAPMICGLCPLPRVYEMLNA